MRRSIVLHPYVSASRNERCCQLIGRRIDAIAADKRSLHEIIQASTYLIDTMNWRLPRVCQSYIVANDDLNICCWGDSTELNGVF